jgi:hypothetical protein
VRLFHHHRDKGPVIVTAGKIEDRLQARIALKEILEGFLDGMAVDIIRGLGAQARALKAGQNGIIKGDVGLPGVEQDPIAIKGYQLDQIRCPESIEMEAPPLAAGAETLPKIQYLIILD